MWYTLTIVEDEAKQIEAAAKEVRQKFSGSQPTDVHSIQVELYTDSTGDDAVRFVVVLGDLPDGAIHRSEDLKKIDAALAEALLVRQVERVPYTEFVTESERTQSSDSSDQASDGASL
jgi:hypothetical protein